MTKTLRKTIAKMTNKEKSEKHAQFGEKNGIYGKKHTKKSKKKILKALKGKYVGKNSKLFGVPKSEEHKKKIGAISKLRVGKKNPFYGKHHTEETKKKLREARKNQAPVGRKKILADGKIYESCRALANSLGISAGLVTYRIKNKQYQVIEDN